MKFYYDESSKLWAIGDKLEHRPQFSFVPMDGGKVTIIANGRVVAVDVAVNTLKRSNGTTYTDLATMLAEVSPFFDLGLGAGPAEEGAVLYGVERLRNSADPAFIAIGTPDQHYTLPIHNQRKICKVNSSRQVTGYLFQGNINFNENGTASVLDGSDGQDVAVYCPAMYAVLDGSGSSGLYERWIFGDKPFVYDGDVAIEIKAFVQSADNATLESGVNKLRCVRSTAANLAGSGSLATAGGLEYPRTSISRYNMEVYAGNKGDKWKGTYYRDHLVEAAYMYIEYKTKNLKSIFGTLGSGWTSGNWTAYNGSNPVLKVLEAHLSLSGRSDILSKGHLTGTFEKTFNFDNAGTPVTYTTRFGCYRGKILRNGIWNHICGIEYEIQSEADGGLSKVYIQNNPDLIDSNRSDSSFNFKNTYTYVGNASRVDGWSKTSIVKAQQAATVGGGETTYDCKYHWTNIPASGTSRRCVLEGGSLNDGSSVAFGSSYSALAPSLAAAYFGVGFRADVAG